ncbi:MAG: permease [Bryobacterales bacterium]|nr:permease [Bryobacterales bacterium]
MDWRTEWKKAAWVVGVFLTFYYLPLGNARFDRSVLEGLHLARWYAEEHVLLCLVPAFFIAGAIAVFINSASVMRYLGAKANKVLAYGVASVSGTILAVCSCTVLPLFAGIYRMGAGLGPATAFLYSGPAINVLAIVLTARVLGWQLGVARAVGAIVFSIVIGLAMHFLFRREEMEKAALQAAMPVPEVTRPLWKNAVFFATMVAILVFANWGKPQGDAGVWNTIFDAKWAVTGAFALGLGAVLSLWFGVAWTKVGGVTLAVIGFVLAFPHEPVIAFTAGFLGLTAITLTSGWEMNEWFVTTWDFAKQILPLLLAGVLVAGMLLGRPGEEGLIPSTLVSQAVGGNSWQANLFASVAGAFMYFATLTEIPILQGLLGSGMGQGPALALLLAGPALSLPNMLVIHSVMGLKKTVAFVSLVIVLAAFTGMMYGALVS